MTGGEPKYALRMRVPNWDRFQHYSRRLPPWIKLYRSLIDDMAWTALPDSAARLLPEIWLLASASEDGSVAYASDWLAWRLRHSSAAQIEEDLKTLSEAGFLVLPNEEASVALARGYREATPETETETETEDRDREENLSVYPAPSDLERNGSGFLYPAEFEVAWTAYPKRAGANPKLAAYRAWRARVAEGVEPEELLEGVRRYLAYVRAETRENTKYVKQAATFFGPDRWWDEAWEPDRSDDPNLRLLDRRRRMAEEAAR